MTFDFTPRRASLIALASALTLGACADTATDFEREDHVRTWANTASAYAVYGVANEVIAFADGQSTFPDVACPLVSYDGDDTVIEGGCTTTQNVTWVGRAVVTSTDDGSRDVSLEAFGHAEDADPPRDTGTVSVRREATDVHTFAVDVTRDGLVSLVVDYDGRVEGAYGGPTTWSGSGTLTRGGFGDPSGTVTASTEGQRRDGSVCNDESLSGTTTIVSGEHTLVVSYDGASVCDGDSNTPYSVDGDDRGLVDGVSCAVSPGARGGAGAGLGLLGALALLAWRRRR